MRLGIVEKMYIAISVVYCFAISITESQVAVNYGGYVPQPAESRYYFLPKHILQQQQENLFLQPLPNINQKVIRNIQLGDNNYSVLYKYPQKQTVFINSNEAQNPQENRRYKIIYKTIYKVSPDGALDTNKERSGNHTIVLKYGHNDNIRAINNTFSTNSSNVKTDSNNINEVANINILLQRLFTRAGNVTNNENNIIAKDTNVKPERTDTFSTRILKNYHDIPDSNIKVSSQNVINEYLNNTSNVAKNDSMYERYDFYNRQGSFSDNVNIVDILSSKYNYNGSNNLNIGIIPSEKFSNAETTPRNSDYWTAKLKQLLAKNYTDTNSKKVYSSKSDNNLSKNYSIDRYNIKLMDFEPNPVTNKDNEVNNKAILGQQNVNHQLNNSAEIQPDSDWYTYQVNVVPETKLTDRLTKDDNKSNIFSITPKFALQESKNSLEISGNVAHSKGKDQLRVIDINAETQIPNTAYENKNIYSLNQSTAYMNGTRNEIVDRTYSSDLDDSGVGSFNIDEETEKMFNNLNAKNEDPVKDTSMAKKNNNRSTLSTMMPLGLPMNQVNEKQNEQFREALHQMASEMKVPETTLHLGVKAYSSNIKKDVLPIPPTAFQNTVSPAKPTSCENTELLMTLLNVLMELLSDHSLKFGKDKLALMMKYLDDVPEGPEKNEMIKKIKDLDANEYKNPSNEASRNLFKSRAQIDFKTDIPKINQQTCKETLANLIQNAYNTYLQLTNFPLCQQNGQYSNVNLDFVKYLPQYRSQDLSFDIKVSNPTQQIPDKDFNLFYSHLNPDGSSNDLMNLQTQGLNKNLDIISILQNYRPGQTVFTGNEHLNNGDLKLKSKLPLYSANNFVKEPLNNPVIGLTKFYNPNDYKSYIYLTPNDSKNVFRIFNNKNYKQPDIRSENLQLPVNESKPPVNVLLDDINNQTVKHPTLEDIVYFMQNGKKLPGSPFINDSNSYTSHSKLPSNPFSDAVVYTVTPTPKYVNNENYSVDNPLIYFKPKDNEAAFSSNKNPNLNILLVLLHKYLPKDINGQFIALPNVNSLEDFAKMFPEDVWTQNFPNVNNPHHQVFDLVTLEELLSLLPKDLLHQMFPNLNIPHNHRPSYVFTPYLPNGNKPIEQILNTNTNHNNDLLNNLFPKRNIPDTNQLDANIAVNPDIYNKQKILPNLDSYNVFMHPYLVPNTPYNQNMSPKQATDYIKPENLQLNTYNNQNILPNLGNYNVFMHPDLVPNTPYNQNMSLKQATDYIKPENLQLDTYNNQNILHSLDNYNVFMHPNLVPNTRHNQNVSPKQATDYIKPKNSQLDLINPQLNPGPSNDKLLVPDLQRLLAVTNLFKLDSKPNTASMIELTYLLKRLNPLLYQPYYYVKYKLPYVTFMNNIYRSINNKSKLRANPAKLYQELISLSNVTDVSPDLKGISKDDILELVLNNGALVNAKVLNGNDTFLNEQLKIIQNLNSEMQTEDLLKLHNDNIKHNETLYNDTKNVSSEATFSLKINNVPVKPGFYLPSTYNRVPSYYNTPQPFYPLQAF